MICPLRSESKRMRNMVVFFALLSGLCLFMIGCAHYPPTTSLTSYDENNGYRFNLLPSGKNSDSLFICLTFSGGGTRAGAFAYGALSKLAAVPITWKGETKQLLDEVDCISSVSGGSFTAAYYALYGDEIFKSFGEKFIYRDIEQDLLGKLLSPLNWIRLASPYFSRIDLAAELYDETIFDRKTFGDLMLRQRRPFLILNSTHLQSGERFEFSQSQFDLVGSDLLTFPVGRAVAASSAFPSSLARSRSRIILRPIAFLLLKT